MMKSVKNFDSVIASNAKSPTVFLSLQRGTRMKTIPLHIIYDTVQSEYPSRIDTAAVWISDTTTFKYTTLTDYVIHLLIRWDAGYAIPTLCKKGLGYAGKTLPGWYFSKKDMVSHSSFTEWIEKNIYLYYDNYLKCYNL